LQERAKGRQESLDGNGAVLVELNEPEAQHPDEEQNSQFVYRSLIKWLK
jgi:hypothetical protein